MGVMTLSQREFLEENADLRADEPAIRSVDTGETMTYAEFEAAVNQLASGLFEAGFRADDRIGIALRNTVEFPVAMYACHELGLVAIPINYRLSAGAIRTIFDDANVAAVIYDETFAETVESAANETSQPTMPIRVGGDAGGTTATAYEDLMAAGETTQPPQLDRRPEDQSYFIYTSGTTGKPKGVVHTERSARERTIAAITGFGIDSGSVVLSQLPYFHGGGLDAALRAAITVGAELVVSPDYANPSLALETIERHEVTHVIGIPTVTRRVIEEQDVDDYDLSSIECWYHTGEVMLEDRARQFQSELTPNVINSYGSSEGGFITVLRSDVLTEQAGTVGRPTLGTQVRVVDLEGDGRGDPSETVERGEEGEVVIKSDQLFEEYFQNTAATQSAFRDGWYYTNDLGYVNEDGYLKITGRVDDIIISGGELIAPAEVETTLESHPAVDEAVVVGETDEEWGERVVAHVSTDGDVSADELDAFCREEDELADYKRPRNYDFVSNIEHTETGKKARNVYRD
jgi:acyl-CoA synthetase (AMP-forming)/AMP-acid ligase II